MPLEKALALVFSLLILGQAYLVRRIVGTWLFPACIFGLFWFGYTFFPLTVLYWLPVDALAIAFIFLCASAFSAGSLFFDWKNAIQENRKKRLAAALVYGSPFLKASFQAATLASLVFIILYSMAQGFTLGDFLSDFFESATAFALMRYNEELHPSLYGPMGIVSAYVGVILGGLLFSAAPTKKERRLILIMSFLPSVLVALTQLSKGLLLLSVILFYAGLLVFRISTGNFRLLEKGAIKTLMLSGATVLAITTLSIFSRGLHAMEDASELIDAVTERYALYAFGHVYAFSDWFSFLIGRHSEISYTHESATYGFLTFAPLFRMMGSQKELPLGFYDDFYSIGGVLTTNIFTFFRGLIQDFGLIGCLLFMFVAGVLLHWAFHSLLRNPRPVFTVAVFIFMLGYSYMTFGISLFIWNTIYVTFLLIWMVLQINKLMTQSGGEWLIPLELPGAGAGPHSQLLKS